MDVNKTSTANLLAVVDRVKAELEAIAAAARGRGARPTASIQDASLDVRKGLGQLRDAGLIGGLLAILAVFFFLRRFRTTLLIALAIPISVVATFVLLYFLRQGGVFDITLNVVSLAGLMLALGMLVDNSIVVIESIFRHRNELGEDARTAALHGTSEVALPIVASTATTHLRLPAADLPRHRRPLQALHEEHRRHGLHRHRRLAAGGADRGADGGGRSCCAARTSRPATVHRLADAAATAGVLGFTLRHRFAFVISILVMFGGSWSTCSRPSSGRSPSRSLERQIIVKVDTPRQYSLAQTAALYDEVYAHPRRPARGARHRRHRPQLRPRHRPLARRAGGAPASSTSTSRTRPRATSTTAEARDQLREPAAGQGRRRAAHRHRAAAATAPPASRSS